MLSIFKSAPRWLQVTALALVVLIAGRIFSGNETAVKYDPAQCQSTNKGPFAGRILYTCTVMAIAERHKNLLSYEARDSFLKEWLHKFDHTDLLKTEEGTLRAISEMVLSVKGRFDFVFTPSAVAQNEIIEKGELAGIGANVAMPMSTGGRGMPQIRLPEHATPQLIAMLKMEKAPQAVITAENPLVVIADPAEGTPASKGGMKKGDVIFAVDGNPVKGKTLDEVLSLIRGEPGTLVRLTVLRQAEKTDLNLTRAIVDLKTTAERKIDDVGYVRIAHFESMRVVNDLHKSIDALCGTESVTVSQSADDCGPKAMIIDLRSNPGGRFDAVVLVSELFLEKGDLSSVMMRDKNKTVRSDFVLEKDNLVVKEDGKSTAYKRQFDLHFPMDRKLVVLVDEYSASGAEAMATILQQQRHATVVGVQTRGKGVGQCDIGLPFGYAANFICMEYLAGGKAVDWVGVTPDIVFDGPKGAGQDLQLEMALKIARGQSNVSPANAGSVAAHERRIIEQRKKAYDEEVADTLERFFK